MAETPSEGLKARVGEIKGELEKRGYKYNAETLDASYQELGKTLEDVATRMEKALAQLGDDEAKSEARKVFGRELEEVITALARNLQVSREADKVVDAARRELSTLGLIIDKGPGQYPPPRLFGLLGKSQVEQWMAEADRNPAVAIKSMMDHFAEERTELASARTKESGATVVADASGVGVYNEGTLNALEEHRARLNSIR